jgi:hypothetical protein
LQSVAGAGPEYSELLSLPGGDLLLGGSEGTLISLLVNFDSANLSGGNICLSAWQMGHEGALNKLQLMQLNQQGLVLHTAVVGALRGQVAGGPEGSCAILYDRAPSVNKGQYLVTVFDHAFTRQWSAPVSQTSTPGPEFDLVTVPDGYLAQIGNVLLEYGWSGKELWTETEVHGTVSTLVAATKDGFFVITKDLHMNNGFHVKRVTTTREPELPER